MGNNIVSLGSQAFGITWKRDNCYSDGGTRSSGQKSNSRGGISEREAAYLCTYITLVRTLKRSSWLVAKFTVCRRQEVSRSSHTRMTKDNGPAMRIRTDSTGKVCWSQNRSLVRVYPCASGAVSMRVDSSAHEAIPAWEYADILLET